MVSIYCMLINSLEVRLAQSGENIQCEVSCLTNSTKITSLVIGLSLKDFLRHSSSPYNTFSRFLQIDEKTLRVAYIGGLKAGGCCCSSHGTSTVPLPKIAENTIEGVNLPKASNTSESDLSNEQVHAMQVVKLVSEPMSFGTMNTARLDKLRKICPYECTMPQDIAKILLESCRDNEFWTSLLYLDDRSAVSQILRKFLIASILKTPNAEHYDKKSIDGIAKNLEEIQSRIETSVDYPELTTVIDLRAAIRLISDSKYISKRWEETSKGCPGISNVIQYPRELISPSLIASISRYFASISKPTNASFIDLIFELEVMETAIKYSSESCSETIEAYISQKISTIPALSWEEVSIFLGFLTMCITYGKVERPFAATVFSTLKDLAGHQTWQIREKCASSLRILRNNQDLEVRARAHELHQIMKQEERKRRDGHQGIINILKLMPQRIDQKYQQKECIHNFDNSRRVVGRESEVAEIEELLKSHRLLALVGEGGMGKSSVAQKYAQEMQFSCKIVWQINSESNSTLLEGLNSLAEKLGVEIKDNKDVINNLKIKLSGSRDLMLVLFDNCANQAQIDEYCVENPRVKYLATSRSTEWEDLIQIKKLTPDASLAFLQSLIRNFKEKEEMKFLVEKLDHWPLAIQQSAGIINSKKITVKQLMVTLEVDLGKQFKMQTLFYQVFVKLEMPSIRILQLLSVCDSQAIPEAMIREIILKEFTEGEWWKSRSSLVNRYIVSVEGEFWNLHRILHAHIRNNYQLTEFKVFVEYYTNKFVIGENIWSTQNLVQEIRQLKPHVAELLNQVKEYGIQEINILSHVVDYFLNIDVNYDEAAICLDKLCSIIKNTTKLQKNDLGECYRRLGYLYYEITGYEKAEEFYLKCLKISEEMTPNHPTTVSLYMNLGNLYLKLTNYDKSEEFFMRYLKIQEEKLSPGHPQLAAIYMNLGVLYKNKTNYSQCEYYYNKCLTIREATLPSNHPDLSRIYMNLGNLYKINTDYNKTEEFYSKCLKINEEILPPSHPDLAGIYTNMAALYREKADYQRSEEFYLKSLKILEEALPPTHPELAGLFMNLANLYDDKANYKKAEEFYMKCKKIQEEILQPNHPDLASLYMNLGNVYSNRADYDIAEEFYVKCLKIREEILPPGHPKLAKLFMNLGVFYTGKAEYTRAEEFYVKCVKIEEELLPQSYPGLADVYEDMGNMYSEKKEYNRAEEFYFKSLKIREEVLPPSPIDIADLYGGLGSMYNDMTEYAKAEEFYTKCLKIRQEILPENHPHMADLYMDMGVLFCDKEDYDRAEEFYSKSLKIREEILPKNHPHIADIYLELGVLYSDKEEFEKAEEFYKICLKIRQEILPPTHPDITAIYMNLGSLYTDEEEYDQAEEFYMKCLKIREEVLPPSHPDLADTYMDLGLLHKEQEEYHKAEEFFIKCLKIREKILPQSHPDIADLYQNFGSLYKHKKEYGRAEEFYMKCLKIKEETLPPNHSEISDLYMNLGSFYSDKSDNKKAEEYYMKCLKIREDTLPANDELLADVYMDLGCLHWATDNYKQAEEYYLKCSKIREEILTENDEDLITLYHNMFILYEHIGDHEKTEEYRLKSADYKSDSDSGSESAKESESKQDESDENIDKDEEDEESEKNEDNHKVEEDENKESEENEEEGDEESDEEDEKDKEIEENDEEDDKKDYEKDEKNDNDEEEGEVEEEEGKGDEGSLYDEDEDADDDDDVGNDEKNRVN